ncbi:MAG: hypothetical protein ABH846_02080 [Patescibacteria group bacterium]
MQNEPSSPVQDHNKKRGQLAKLIAILFFVTIIDGVTAYLFYGAPGIEQYQKLPELEIYAPIFMWSAIITLFLAIVILIYYLSHQQQETFDQKIKGDQDQSS